MWIIFIILTIIFTAAYIYFSYRRSLEKVKNWGEKYVLITGCEDGFGRTLAMELIVKKIPVFACCLTNESADKLKMKARIVDENAQIWTPIHDFTKDGYDGFTNDAKQVADSVCAVAGDNGLWAIVCNDITNLSSVPVPDEWLPTTDYKNMLIKNVIAIIRTCHSFTAHLRRSKGRIIIGSVGLGIPESGFKGPSAVNKFAIEAYANTIRNELALQGISVVTIIGSCNQGQENVDEIISKSWESTSGEVRSSFGEEYCNHFKHAAKRSLPNSRASNRTVMDTYINALTSKYPCSTYYVPWSSIAADVFRLFPVKIQDWLSRQYWRFYLYIPIPPKKKSH